jgi:hypothetical protein
MVMIFFIIMSVQAEQLPSKKWLFKQTLYAQLTTDETLTIEGFSNHTSPYTDKNAIESIHLSSFDEHFKLIPKSFEIHTYGHYTYLGDRYTKHTFVLKLPTLEVDYYIKDCYLTIILKNGERLISNIGRLSLMKPSLEQELSIYNQYGHNRDEGVFLNHIVLDISVKRPIQIESVCYTVNHCVEILETIQTQKTIEITIESDVFYYSKTPLRIFYTLEGTLYAQTVDTFIYFESMSTVIPENSLNRIYVID